MSTTLPPAPYHLPQPDGSFPSAVPPQGKGPSEQDGFAIPMTGIAPDMTPSLAPEVTETAAVLSRPWYRTRRAAFTAFVAVLSGAATATALMLTVFASPGPTGPERVLAKDGYAIVDTMDAGQVASYISSGAAGQDAKAIQGLITSAAAGIKGSGGSQAEVVIGLKPEGVPLFTVAVPQMNSHGSMPAGVTAHMDGSNVVLDGPASALDNGTGPGVS